MPGKSWFARVAAVLAALTGGLGVLGAPGLAGRLEVGLLSAFAVAGFLAAARWPLPDWLLMAWTFPPPIVLLLRWRGEGVTFLLIIALFYFVLAEDDRHRRLVVGTLTLLTPLAVELAVHPDWGWPFWTGGTLFGWLSAEQMRNYRRLVTELAVTRERLAEQAVHLERRRIAAELHDVVGHSLGVLLLHIAGARRRLRDDPAAAEEALHQAEGIGRAGLADIRRSVVALRGAAGTALAPIATAADVPELVDRTTAAGARVHLAVTGELAEIESICGLAVYRVVQESLVNATRHAPGAEVRVYVDVTAAAVEVCVRDTGPGAPYGAVGVGLVGMRERVQALGGTFAAGRTSSGWQVLARLPRAAAGQPVTST